MAVKVLTFTLIAPQLVGSRKFGFDHQFVHGGDNKSGTMKSQHPKNEKGHFSLDKKRFFVYP